MSKFLKFLVNIFLVLAILVTGAIFLPPVLGVNTTVVDSETMDTNLPLGSITYSKTVNVLDLQGGDEILKEVSSSVHAYIIETGDVNTGKYTVRDAMDKAAGTTEISLRNNVSKVVLTVPYLGYIVMIMQTTEGMIIAILLVIFVIILFVLSELWKHNEEEDEADEEDIVDDDGEQVEEILDDDEAREAIESAGAVVYRSIAASEASEAGAGEGSGKVGGDTKEVKIAPAPDTSVEVKRGDTEFLVNELASIGKGKDGKELPVDAVATLSEELSGERGSFSVGDVSTESYADGKKADTVEEELYATADSVPAAGTVETEAETDFVKAEIKDGPEVTGDNGEVLREGTAALLDETPEGGFDWTKFEVGSPQEETAAVKEEPAAVEPKTNEAGAGYVKAAAAKVGEKAVKPAPGKPARRFRPVERLTLEEILEHAKKSGAAEETQASRDSVTGVDFVDYSDLL